MRVLIINKFLYPNGGSETYIFKLGEALEQHGHEVQYFGMEHEGRCVGNRVNAYTSDMDFHGGSKLSKLTYPIKTIYSKEARVQLRKVLDDFNSLTKRLKKADASTMVISFERKPDYSDIHMSLNKFFLNERFSSISFLKIVLHSFAQNNDLVRIFRSIFFALVDKLRTKS